MSTHRNVTAYISLITLVLICSLSWYCLAAQHEGSGFLSWASPLVSWWVHSFGERYSNPTKLYKILAFVAFPILTVLAGYLLLSRRYSLAGLIFFTGISGLGEFLILYGHVSWGAAVYGAVIILLSLLFRYTRISGALDNSGGSGFRPTEGVFFCIILFVTAAYRYYLLNLIPSAWDTELCDYRCTGLTTLQNLLWIETAQPRPTSNGFAWTSLYWLLGNLDEPDDYYLYIRLVSAAISLCKSALLYIAVRYISGPLPAFFSVVTLAFIAPENWWARQPSAHHMPGLLAILIVYTTAKAFRTRSWYAFFAAAIASALARTMYASGLFLVFVPLSFFLILTIVYWREWKQEWPKICLLFLGPAMWLLWTSAAATFLNRTITFISPLAVSGSEVASGGLFGLATRVFSQTLPDFLRNIFIQQVNPTHWDIAFTLAPARSTSSLTLILGVMGLARVLSGRAGAISFLLLITIFWSALPGLVTSVADRRVGAVFVVLIMFAANELASVLNAFRQTGLKHLCQAAVSLLIAAMGAYLSWISMGLHFRDEPRLPIQVIQGRLIRPLLEPGTLVVYLAGGMHCDTFMTVVRALREGGCSVGWAQPPEAPDAIDRLIANPRINVDLIKERDPVLAQCYAQSNQRWKKVKFLYNNRSNWSEIETKLEQMYPQGIAESFRPPGGYHPEFILYSYTIQAPQI